MEIFKIPKDQRVVVGIDLKSGTEIGKSQYCLDAFAISIETADTILTNVAAEMDRRHRLINSNPKKYWDGKTHPSAEVPLLVCFVDELAMLGKKQPDKELEEIRKHAWSAFDRLLYLGRNAGICTISCIQRPDAKIVDGFTRAQYQSRLCGYVSNRMDNDMVFGTGAAEQGHDASKLTNHWFIAFIEGKGYQNFKTPGDPGDADLKDVFLNPRYYCPKGRGDWLTAEPDTPAAIAPWWPDSPYHEAFLNGFRDEDDEDDDEYGYEPANDPSDEYDDEYDDLDECEPFWEEPGYEPSSRPASRSRRAGSSRSRRRASAGSSDHEMPWDEPERPKRRPARRSPGRMDYEDIEETSLEDLMDMVVDPSTVPQPKSKPKARAKSRPEPSGPRVEYRRQPSSPAPSEVVDDLNSFFQEVDDEDEAFWGGQVVGDSDDDELLDDYETAMRDVVNAAGGQVDDAEPEPLMALPPHEYKSHPAHRDPAPYPTQAPTGKRKQVAEEFAEPRSQRPAPSGKKPASSRSKASATKPSKKDGEKKPVRRRRRRYEVEEEFLNPSGERPEMINGMPVL